MQVKLGWLGEPLPIDLKGDVATYDRGAANIAFRFGADQAAKLRAGDDIRQNAANLYCTVWTPIKLPKWGHISQMCPNVRTPERKWAFFKEDHQAAYKHHPMALERRKLAMVSLRDLATIERTACPPKALLFGSTSEVLHYN